MGGAAFEKTSPGTTKVSLVRQTTSVERRRPSILAVTSQLPWPLDRGGHLRTFHLLRGLASRYRVRLVAGAATSHEDAVRALAHAGITTEPATLGARTWYGEAWRAGVSALRREPYVFFTRHDRRPMWQVLERELMFDPPGALYLDHLDSLLFVRALGMPTGSPIPIVLDLHNVYSSIVQREGRQRHGVARWYLGREATLLEQVERQAVQLANLVFVVSEQDSRYFSGLGAERVAVVPNGVDCGAYETLPTGREGSAPLMLYVGALSWPPNIAAARSLVTDVLPLVRQRIPDARVRLIGRDPAAEVRALGDHPGVELHDAVADLIPHLREARLLAVPLAVAGGTRLKILEAFAAGLPVVSSPIGCEGLPVSDGVHLRIASGDRFARTVVETFEDVDGSTRRAAQARALVRARFDWDLIGKIACTQLGSVLEQPLGAHHDGHHQERALATPLS